MIKAIETRYKGYRFRSADPPAEPEKRISRRADYTGQRFGRAVAVECLGTAGNGYRWWGCLCDCGTRFAARSRELSRGHTKSCGCLAGEIRRSSAGKNSLPAGQSALNQLYYAYRKSASTRRLAFRLTIEEFRTITQQDCFYCGAPPVIKFRAAKGTNGDYIGNGIDRADNNLGYAADNVRPCCTACNVAKAAMTEDEFAAWVGRVYRHYAARFEHGESGAPR